MVALTVVLGDELPVRADLVRDRVGGLQPREVEPREVRRQVAEPLEERRRLRGEVDEDEALPRFHSDRDEAERLETEVIEVVGVLGPDSLPSRS